MAFQIKYLYKFKTKTVTTTSRRSFIQKASIITAPAGLGLNSSFVGKAEPASASQEKPKIQIMTSEN